MELRLQCLALTFVKPGALELPCQSASLWDRTVRMTMSSAAHATCKSARRIFCTNWVRALCPVNLCPIVMLQPEFKIVIHLTICNSANTLSQIRNKLNKSYIDSLLISTWHQNLLVGCACLTRKGYEPQHLVKDCSLGHHNFCKREFPPLFVALSANLAGNRCTLALIAGKLSTTASCLFFGHTIWHANAGRPPHLSFAVLVPASPVD